MGTASAPRIEPHPIELLRELDHRGIAPLAYRGEHLSHGLPDGDVRLGSRSSRFSPIKRHSCRINDFQGFMLYDFRPSSRRKRASFFCEHAPPFVSLVLRALGHVRGMSRPDYESGIRLLPLANCVVGWDGLAVGCLDRIVAGVPSIGLEEHRDRVR
jgi:hypothetical protein